MLLLFLLFVGRLELNYTASNEDSDHRDLGAAMLKKIKAQTNNAKIDDITFEEPRRSASISNTETIEEVKTANVIQPRNSDGNYNG